MKTADLKVGDVIVIPNSKSWIGHRCVGKQCRVDSIEENPFAKGNFFANAKVVLDDNTKLSFDDYNYPFVFQYRPSDISNIKDDAKPNIKRKYEHVEPLGLKNRRSKGFTENALIQEAVDKGISFFKRTLRSWPEDKILMYIVENDAVNFFWEINT